MWLLRQCLSLTGAHWIEVGAKTLPDSASLTLELEVCRLPLALWWFG